MMPTVLYEDNHLLVAIKPPGVLSQAGDLDLPDMLTLLKAYIKEKYDKPGNVFLGLVHRLDVNVGGVMVFAKTSKGASRLSEQIRNRTFEKRYLGVVDGLFDVGLEGRFTDRLIKDAKTGSSRIVGEGDGQASSLVYRVVACDAAKRRSLFDIDLETGRFHQIRMQLSSRGAPLVGDAKYGTADDRDDRQIGLWAYRLSIDHPVSGERLTFASRPQGWMFDAFSKSMDEILMGHDAKK